MNPGKRFGNPETTPHDRGIRFASSIIVRLRSSAGDLIKEDDIPIGQIIKFQIKKNKNYMPFRVGQFDFSFKTGEIDNIKSIIEYGVAYNLIKRSGAYYYIEKNKFQGMVRLVEYLREEKKFLAKLRKDVLNIVLKG